MVRDAFWRGCLIFGCAVAVFGLAGVSASESASPNALEESQKEYERSRLRHRAQPQNAEFAWQFARACFYLAGLVESDNRREIVAEEGIASCQSALSSDPKVAPAHYYLALNRGQLARTKTLGALKLVKQMEQDLSAAIAIDSKFNYAGPHRSLGLLYAQAPGWPASIGDAKKARSHLEKAVALFPKYPENRLYLIETLIEWKERAAAAKHYQLLKEHWAKSKEEFAGDLWRRDWMEWDQRRKAIEQQLKP